MASAFFILIFTLLFTTMDPVSADECPMIFERFCSNHSYCLLANRSCEILAYYPTNDDITLILQLHNKHRNVTAMGEGSLPIATDMLQMEWDNELAAVAQKYADQCRYEHDLANCRRVMNFGVGQNLAIQQLTNGHVVPQPDWDFAVNIWYSEIRYMTPDRICPFNPPKEVGEYRHFTQLIWARTFRVGCGYVLYKDAKMFPDETYTRLYVCNYGPAGNVYGDCVYQKGAAACTNCPLNACCGNACKYGDPYNGLCKRTNSQAPSYPPPLPNLFYCNFQNEPDCDNYIIGKPNWTIEPALSGAFLNIVLNGGENSTLVFKKSIEPLSDEFCITLQYRKGPNNDGQEEANNASGVFNVEDLEYTHYQPLKSYPNPARQQFSTFNLTLSWNQITQMQFFFSVPPGKPAQFFNVQSVIATDGKCIDKPQ